MIIDIKQSRLHFSPHWLIIIHDIIFDKFSANSFQIKLKNRSTATNLLDEALQEDLIKKSNKRKERFYCSGYSKNDYQL
jgi:hypothetical protein